MKSIVKKNTPIIVFALLVLAIIFIVQKASTSSFNLQKSAAPNSIRQNPDVTIENFKTSYSQMIQRYSGGIGDIQLFSGGTVLKEFNDGTGKIYAGHLGNFWAAPHFSSTNHWTSQYNLGLVIKTRDGCFTEQSSDPQTEAFWYPSKMVVSKNYLVSGGNIQIKGVKVALPLQRGFGLKLTFTNNSSSSQDIETLLLGDLPTFSTVYTTNNGEYGLVGSWVWATPSSTSQNTFSEYLPVSSIITTKSNTPGLGYVATSLSQTPGSWGIDNSKMVLYNKFRANGCLSGLDNQNNDNSTPGTSYGFVNQINSLPPGQSKTVTLLTGLGDSPTSAQSVVNYYKNKDIEREADNYWNNKISQFFQNAPYLETGNSTLNKIYLNSILSYLVNKRDLSNSLGEAVGSSKSLALFPWMTGVQGIFAYDNVFWKEQLKKIISLDINNCRSYDNIAQQHLCDQFYAYDGVSIIDAVYKYVATTGNYNFLSERIGSKQVIDYLNDFIQMDSNREIDDNLANFGHDWNLYEYPRHAENCGLGGKYTGKVVSPNAERVVSLQQFSELIKKKNPQADTSQYIQKAEDIKRDINNKLWNVWSNNFNSISLYNADRSLRQTPYVNTFLNIMPYFLFQYDGLLATDQVDGLMQSFGGFQDEYGINSLHQSFRRPDGTWCSDQTDWHGPGIYSGALGAVLTGLYRQNYANLAYNILLPENGKGYHYLSQMPYFSQAFDATKPKSSLALAYLEGVSVAGSVIEGMFGVQPKIDYLEISPHIPDRLLSSGPVKLKNILVQKNLWEITVTSQNNHQVRVSLGQDDRSKFWFVYKTNGVINLEVSNLIPNQSYRLTVNSTPSLTFVSNNEGKINASLPLNGLSTITINTSTNNPSPFPPTRSVPSPRPTAIITPTENPPLVTPVLNSCTGGCYGNKDNCRSNCGSGCTKLSISETQTQCGWPNAQAYRCCKTVIKSPSSAPSQPPVLIPTSVPIPLAPTGSVANNCVGKYFGKWQCDSRADKTLPGSCQLNPALGTINPDNIDDPVNYWKWSYCLSD